MVSRGFWKKRKPGVAWVLGVVLLAGCHQRRPTGAIPPVAEAAGRAARYYAQAAEAYAGQGRWEEAGEAWQMALEMNPNEAAWRERLGQVRSRISRASGEDSAFPDSPVGADLALRVRGDLQKAETAYRESYVQEARERWEQILAVQPGNAAAAEGLKRLQAEVYRRDPAGMFDRLTEELFNQGMRAYRRMEWSEAGEKFLEANRLSPDQDQVADYLRKSRSRGDEAGRRQWLREAEAGARKSESAGDWAGALTYWRKLSADPQAGAEAEEGILRATQHLSGWAEERVRAAEQALRNGKNEAAMQGCREVLEAWPEHLKARGVYQKAAAGNARRQSDQAERAEARRHFEAGERELALSRPEEAVRRLENAVALDPGPPEYRERLSQARAAAQTVRERARRQAEVRYSDGLAAYQRGEVDQALEAWKEALALDPDLEKARLNIQRVQAEMRP